MPTIYIRDDTANAIGQLGNTFDTPDDVVQMVIREAGYGHLLEGQDKAEDGEDESEPTREDEDSDVDPKERLRQEIDAKFEIVRKPNPQASAWVVDLGAERITLWPHYSADFYHWPVTTSVEAEFEAADRELWHLFFGDGDDERAVISHETFKNEITKTKDEKEGRWVVYESSNRKEFERSGGIDVLQDPPENTE